MNKIKNILTPGRGKHGDEGLSGDSEHLESKVPEGAKLSIHPKEWNDQPTVKTTAGNTTSGSSNTTTTASSYPGGSTATGNTAPGNRTTGSTAAGNTGTGYPVGSATAAHNPSGQRTSGNTTAGNTTSGNATVGKTAAQSASTGYQTGNTATDSTRAGYPTAANTAGLSSEGPHLSRGPNEGMGITSGLGSQPGVGSGNTYVEEGLTRGFQSTGAASDMTGRSGAQAGNITGRDNLSSNTGYQDTSTSATSGHQLGRDATLGSTGTAAQGSHLHGQDERGNVGSGTGYNTTATTQPTSQRLGRDTVAAGTAGPGSHLHRQTGRENLGSEAGYNTGSADKSSEHHLERDAAVLGGAGAAGAGVYHQRQNDSDKTGSNAGYTGGAGNTSSGVSGAYSSGTHGTAVSGPHSTEAANLLDPAVNTSGKGNIEDSHYHSRSHEGGGAGGAGLSEQRYSKQGTAAGGTTSGSGDTTGPSGHRQGSDVAGGAGAAAGSSGASGLPGPAPNTAGPHKHDWMNRLDPRVDAYPDTTQTSRTDSKSSGMTGQDSKSGTTGQDSHYGRDAATGAGLGGIGGAAYGAEKRGHQKTDSGVAGISPTTRDTTTGGAYSSKTARSAEQQQDASANKSATSTGGQGAGAGLWTSGATTSDKTASGQQYGRDTAAVGGGVGTLGGAAATGEQEYQKHERFIPLSGQSATRDVDERLQGSEVNRGVTSDKGATGATGASRSLPDRIPGDHQYGPDAAIGASGAGGVGLAGDELHKHEGVKSSGPTRTSEQQQTTGGALFGSHTADTGNQYGANTSNLGNTQPGLSSSLPKDSNLRHHIPGAFPDPSSNFDTYGNPITGTQDRDAATAAAAHALGEQEYRTAKNGPTMVADDETGRTRLHKEPLDRPAGSRNQHNY